jgi:hypothetical protein
MKMLLSRFPEEILDKYNLKALAVDGWVYIEIRKKGMYGLKQAGLLANQLMQTLLAPFGYYPAHHTPGIWLHKTRPIDFSLIVDNFAVKNVGKQHADHLRDALLQSYELTTDWEAKIYSGMYLKWDYKNRTCDISMPGYVSNVLSKFQHDAPKHPQHTPSKCKTTPTPAAPVARPHGRTDKSKRPESHPTKERARARLRCRKTEPNYYHCPITLVMSLLIALV